MTTLGSQDTDRVEAFISTIDSYDPSLLKAHEDTFRVFARFISRTIDSRYLERHPPPELLPDIEHLMHVGFQRAPGDIIVHVRPGDDPNSRRGTLVTCMPDQLFIYSVVRLGLDFLQIKTYRSINSIIPILRDADGNISLVGSADAPRESFIWVEIDAENLHARTTEIEHYLQGRLQAARQMVEDFHKIHRAVESLAEHFEVQAQPAYQEHQALLADNARLLRWLLNEHFVFLGTRFLPPAGQHSLEPPLEPVNDFGTGRFTDWRGIRLERFEQDLLKAHGQPPFLWIRKSHTDSWVYRSGRTDYLLVQCFDEQGHAAGLLLIEGLFSYPALAEPRTSVPMLDRMIDRLYTQLQATKGSHRYRTIRNAFNSLPLEYVFALSSNDIRKLVEQVLEVDAQHRSQIHITTDKAQSIAFVFVALPRTYYSNEIRVDIRRLLKERFQASAVDDGVYAGNLESVTFHYFLTGIATVAESEQEALKVDIDQLASPWSERLYDELVRRYSTKQARHLHSLYNEAFPHAYREETSIGRAVQDISFIETIGDNNYFDCDIYREKTDQPLDVTRLRMFQNHKLLLSDILPILDNFGLVVIDQFPTTVHVPTRPEQIIATFRISGVQGMNIDLTTRATRLRNAICAVVLGAMGSNPLNRLLLRADIPWPNVVLVLAYQRYAQQLGSPYGTDTVQEALLRHADMVRSLTELFRSKFDPEIESHIATLEVPQARLSPAAVSGAIDERRLQLVERSRRAVLLQLESVEDLASDQVLRTLYNLIEATVRTNFYARHPLEDRHLVLKFDPQLITRMPEPRPYREIYVHHPQIEGLHLRGGAQARGGIRWSDRLLDFRTEVLGLMATQNLKNVLIVPRGAKGAFVLRNPPSDISQRRMHADDMYKIFIRGLLDVTDNLVDGQPKTPARVLSYEGPDHYLVVAADKGTAHLSDTANQLAFERHFWLGDAFASGGSKGYDHKKEAITSRGAWACVRRHFREIGMDPEQDKIRVSGIGDMSGDVFGNGMLRSQSMQLIAAFDHRHIFIDPDPDPELSYEARLMLFRKPRSSWEDYPKESLSSGAGIYPRGAKAIKLSAQARLALNTSAETLSGPELVCTILRMPVDLLWNGGIGTYIKATTETHLDVGDPANDSVRVDATEVRAKVLGEGGNLGVTAAGRIELAAQGVRLNTDAIDNSAGVDLSDHEVNLKILFKRIQERGALSLEERDTLLEQLRVEVGHKVVSNNWLQSRMISLDEIRSKRNIARFQRAVAFLKDRTPFNRREANLPGERIAKFRAQKGEGLYRPELATLCAYAKLDLRQELGSAEDVFSLEKLKEPLYSYFPTSLRERFAEDILHHPLASSIARTILVNWIIGDAGCSWLPEMTLLTGRSTSAILQAYFEATDLLGARQLKKQVGQLETHLEAAVEYDVRLRIEDSLEILSMWILRRQDLLQGTSQGSSQSTPLTPHDMFRDLFQEALTSIRPLEVDIHVHQLQEALKQASASSTLIHTLASLSHIDEILDTVQLAIETSASIQHANDALHTVGQTTGMYDFTRRVLNSTSTDDLDCPARFVLYNRLHACWVQLSASLIRSEDNMQSLSEKSRAWMETIQRELEELQAPGEYPIANVVVGVDRVARWASVL